MALVGVTKLAEMVRVSHSSVSRYLDEYPGLVRETRGKRRYIDPDEFRRHRGQNINLEGAAQPTLPDVSEKNISSKQVGDPDAVATRKRSSEAKASLDEIKLRTAQVELQEKLGELVSIEEVEAAFTDAGALLQNRLEARRRDLADQIATMKDPREIVSILKTADIEMLTAFSKRLGALAEVDDDPDAEPVDDVEAA